MSNIYLKNLGHVTFENEQQFFATYGPKLLSSSETVLSEVRYLSTFKEDINRLMVSIIARIQSEVEG